MTTTHAVFNMPAGVIGIVFYHVLSDPERLGAYLSPIWTLFLLSMAVSLFGSLADFFIYLYAFATFRDSSRHLIYKCCHCCASVPTDGGDNEREVGNPRTSKKINSEEEDADSPHDQNNIIFKFSTQNESNTTK